MKNHQMNQSQPHNTGNALVTRTVLEDKSQINRTASLPILLEKKSVEMKPRYEPKSMIFVLRMLLKQLLLILVSYKAENLSNHTLKFLRNKTLLFSEPIRKRVQSRKETKPEQPPQDRSSEQAEIPKPTENSKKEVQNIF